MLILRGAAVYTKWNGKNNQRITGSKREIKIRKLSLKRRKVEQTNLQEDRKYNMEINKLNLLLWENPEIFKSIKVYLRSKN